MKRAMLAVAAAGLGSLLLALPSARATAQEPAAHPDAAHADAAIDPAQCLSCHEAQGRGMQHTAHTTIPDKCATCHEGAAAHLAAKLEGKEGPGPAFPKNDPKAATAKCQQCHDKGRQAHFDGGMHQRRGVTCVSCHSVHDFHSARAQMKTALEADTCFTCHKDIRAKSLRTSHHPVREGKIGCASCHDPHDSTKPKMVSAEYVNDKCLECHTEKRGPFLWEHAPVRENCLNCHDPHGSNHDKMLVAKLPYLCQRCHLNTRHPGTLYDLRNTATGDTPTGPVTPSNRAVEHACKNCHQNVHGSNAPSGAYLGR
jgi:DmsE family decaheme c-type cytochrome